MGSWFEEQVWVVGGKEKENLKMEEGIPPLKTRAHKDKSRTDL